MHAVVARSHAVRTLVWGAARVRELHPGKTIVLAGIDSDLSGQAYFRAVRPGRRPRRVSGAGGSGSDPASPRKRACLRLCDPPVYPHGFTDNQRPWCTLPTPAGCGRHPVLLRGGAAPLGPWGSTARRCRSGRLRPAIGPFLVRGVPGQPLDAAARHGPSGRAAGRSEKLCIEGFCPAAQVAGRPLRVLVASTAFQSRSSGCPSAT